MTVKINIEEAKALLFSEVSDKVESFIMEWQENSAKFADIAPAAYPLELTADAWCEHFYLWLEN